MLDILASQDVITTDVLIAGTGFGGIAMAIKLREAGFTDFLMIEKAAEIGGTWRDNVYPGCACDIPSHLYSLSFEQKADWSRMYPQQPEIQAYLQEVVAKHNLRPHIRFNTLMTEAAWEETAGRWMVTTSTGKIAGRVLVSGVGALHVPASPKLHGLENFTGKVFHSAQWDHSYKVTGKRVAVIGTGASAIQFVPQIAPLVAQLDVYQRTAPWVIPKPDRVFSTLEKTMLKLPFYRRGFRRFLFLMHELRVLAFLGNPRAQKIGKRLAVNHLNKQISDPVLRRKLTPDYTIGCKRLMISNDYYPALTRKNVELITSGITEIRAHSIIDAAGQERPVDAIILGTGFQVTQAYRHIAITGLGGQRLGDLWDRTGMEAYNGIAIAGFPNYFMLLGPHTALGHNSVVIMIEAQVNYIVDALKKLRAAGGAAISVAPAVQSRFIDDLHTRLRGTTWQDGGCDSWYKDEHGKVSTIWPGSAASYQRAVKSADLRDYEVLATEAAEMSV